MDADAMQESAVMHLLRAGEGYSLLIVTLGLLLTFWGGVNLLRRNPGRAGVMVQAFASLLPAVIGVFGVLASYEQFAVFAMSEVAPRPVDLGRVVTQGMACGLFGPLATVIPVSFGLSALLKTSGAATAADDLMRG